MFIRTDGGDAVLVATRTATHVAIAVAETDVGYHEVCLAITGDELDRMVELLRHEQSEYEGLVAVLHDAQARELVVWRESPAQLSITACTAPSSSEHCMWMVARNGADIAAALASYLEQCRTEVEAVA